VIVGHLAKHPRGMRMCTRGRPAGAVLRCVRGAPAVAHHGDALVGRVAAIDEFGEWLQAGVVRLHRRRSAGIAIARCGGSLPGARSRPQARPMGVSCSTLVKGSSGGDGVVERWNVFPDLSAAQIGSFDARRFSMSKLSRVIFPSAARFPGGSRVPRHEEGDGRALGK